MSHNLKREGFSLFSLFVIGSFAQSLLTVLNQEGFTEFAAFLEGPGGESIVNTPDLLVYAPTNAGFLKYQSPGNAFKRQIDDEDLHAEYQCVKDPYKGNKSKRGKSTCSDVAGPGANDFMTLLDDPEFVNLPPGQNASIVEKNMPKGALPVVHSGLGDVVKVVGLDIPYDNGIIRPVSAFFTLPRLLSITLPFLGADRTLQVLASTGLINDLDNRTGITFLAPDDRSIPSDLPDNVLAEILRRHVIVGTPIFTSDLNHGDTFRTLAGTTLTVTIQCGEVFIGGARILAGDAIIKNGVLHMVDSLLEAPIFVTTTEVQTVTQTTTETAQTTVVTTDTTTETAETITATTETVETPETVTTTETIEVPVPDTTATTTTTVTPVLPPDTTTTTTTVFPSIPPSSSIESTPCTTLIPPSSSAPPSSTSYSPPPPPPSSSSSPPPPPPPPPPPSTPCTSESSPPPPPLPPPSTSTSTPCTSESSTVYSSPTPSTSTSTYTPPPYTPSRIYTPPPPPSDSSTSTPCTSSSSDSTSSTPPTSWSYSYSSTTLITSTTKTTYSHDSWVAPPPSASTPCTTSGDYYGGGGENGDWPAEHEGGGYGGY